MRKGLRPSWFRHTQNRRGGALRKTRRLSSTIEFGCGLVSPGWWRSLNYSNMALGQIKWGHEFGAGTSSGPVTLGNVDRDALSEARIDLAASLRMAARFGLEEGICNHFSAMVPGARRPVPGQPRRPHVPGSNRLQYPGMRLRRQRRGWGRTTGGDGLLYSRPIAQEPARARAAFHTHMPYSTALTMVEGDPLIWAGQTSLKFYGRVAVDDEYNGLALDEAEGDRIATQWEMQTSFSCAVTA